MNNYYIAVDENGTPYIAHAEKLSGSMDRREGSKYYAKEEVHPGVWRYYYSAQEWLAAHNPKAAITNAYNNARAGATNTYNNVRAGVTNTYGRARSAVENFGRQAREDINNSVGMRAVRGVQNAVNTAADKLGFDERKRFKEASKKSSELYETYDTEDPRHDKAWRDHDYAFGMKGKSVTVRKSDAQIRDEAADAEKKRADYEQTTLGKAEKTVGQLKDKAERMREEFRNRNSSQYGEYDKNDPDFDDKNYTEDRRVGDTDFFMFKGKDGRTVILEEDMKWTLPKGIRPDSPEIRSVLEKAYDLPGETWEEWQRNVNDALNEAIKASKRK